MFNFVQTATLVFAIGAFGFAEPAESSTLTAVAKKKPKIPKITITIDFESDEVLRESQKTEVVAPRKATSSGLTDKQKRTAIRQIRKEYEAALGDKAKVKVKALKEGKKPGDRHVVVTGGKSNSKKKPDKGGNAGAADGPAIVYVGAIKEAHDPTDEELATAVGEIAAHETGHRLNLHDNCNKKHDKMTSGKNCRLTREELTDGKLEFSEKDAKKLVQSVKNASTLKKSKRGTGKRTGEKAALPAERNGARFNFVLGEVLGVEGFHPFDIYPQAGVSLASSGALDVGFLGLEREFLLIGDNYSGEFELSNFSFVYDGFLDFALRDSVTGEIVSLSGGDADMKLGPKNPYNASVSRSVSFEFTGLAHPATLTLNMLLDETGLLAAARSDDEDPCCLYGRYTGGFSKVPVPPAIPFLLSACLALAVVRKGRSRDP